MGVTCLKTTSSGVFTPLAALGILLKASTPAPTIYSIFLQTPAWMNNLAGYISNHLLPSLTLTPSTLLLPACGQTQPALAAVPTPKHDEEILRRRSGGHGGLRETPFSADSFLRRAGGPSGRTLITVRVSVPVRAQQRSAKFLAAVTTGGAGGRQLLQRRRALPAAAAAERAFDPPHLR